MLAGFTSTLDDGGLAFQVVSADRRARGIDFDTFQFANERVRHRRDAAGVKTGAITIEEIINILLDVASLSNKLQKPLSARLMPIPGKKEGDLTNYSFSYFRNSRVMK